MELVERTKESKEERSARKKEQKQARDTTATETTTTTAPEVPVPAPVEQKTGDKNRSTQGNKRRKKKVSEENTTVEPVPSPTSIEEDRLRRKAEKKAKKVARALVVEAAVQASLVPQAQEAPTEDISEKKQKKRKHESITAPAKATTSEPVSETPADEAAAAEAKRSKKLRKQAKKSAVAAAVDEEAEEVAEPPKKKSRKGKEKEVVIDQSSPPPPTPAVVPTAADQASEEAKAEAKRLRKLKKAARRLAKEQEQEVEEVAEVDVEPPKKKGRKAPSEPASTPIATAKKATKFPASAAKATAAAASPCGKMAPVVDYAALSSRELLSTQWLPLTKIKELAELHNFEYKKGKFSKAEDTLLHSVLDDYKTANSLSKEDLLAIIFTKGSSARRAVEPTAAFWTTVASKLDGRPVLSVYNHVKRIMAPNRAMGKWSEEEDESLTRGVAELGNAWAKISEQVGRTAEDCRDRWRLKFGPIGSNGGTVDGEKGSEKKKLRTGAWDEKELKKLRKAVRKFGENWAAVARKVKTRTENSCRAQWREVLTKQTSLVDGKPLKWTSAYRTNLVTAVAKLDAVDPSEVDFKAIDDPILKPFGPASLKGYWKTLIGFAVKSGIDSSYPDQVEWLVEQFLVSGAQIKLKRGPRTSGAAEAGTSKGNAKPGEKSQEFISSSDEEDEDEGSDDEED